MPTPSFASLGSREPTNAEIADYLARQRRDMQYLLTNLDDLNISRLNARVIIAGSITTDKLAAAVITTDKLAAGAVTADKISVVELSAISANLGKITAGEIYGTYIATAEGTFPRVEQSSSANLFTAFASASDYIRIDPDDLGTPVLNFVDGSNVKLSIAVLSGIATLLSFTELQLSVGNGGDLRLHAEGNTIVDSWAKLVNLSTGINLQQELNGIWDAIEDLEDRVSALEGP